MANEEILFDSAAGSHSSHGGFLVMLVKVSGLVLLLVSSMTVLAQSTIYESPDKSLKAIIIPAGMKGYETYESRIEVHTSGGRLLRRRSFASSDQNHGEGVGHAEWSSDGQFFVFNTSSSGGHQPWHFATYYYSIRNNRFHSLDRVIGPISSDFKLEGPNTVVMSRLVPDKGQEEVKIALRSLLSLDLRPAPNKRLPRTRR